MKYFITILLLTVCVSMSAQNEMPSVSTENVGRYEIVQCPLVRKYTIRLDKETGDSWLMVTDSDDKLCWQLLDKSKQLSETQYPGKVNYMIFMGGIAARDMFMINVNTGETWQLVNDPKTNTPWWSTMKEIF